MSMSPSSQPNSIMATGPSFSSKDGAVLDQYDRVNGTSNVSFNTAMGGSNTGNRVEFYPAEDGSPRPGMPGDVRYRVCYQDAKGKVLRVQRPRAPFRLSSISDAPVLELVTTVTGSTSSEESSAIESESEDEGVRRSQKKQPLEDQRITQTLLKIRSQELLNALRSVVKYYPGQTLMGDVATFEEPFRLLVHYRGELEAYKDQHPPEHSEEYKETCNEHIDILLRFIKNHFGKSLEDEEQRHKQTPPVCTFEWAWLLLKPGDDIYAETDDQIPGPPSPYVVRSVTGGVTKEGPESYNIGMWNVDSDGYKLGRSVASGYIIPFVGEREITSLSAYPTRFHLNTLADIHATETMTLEQRLIARGRKFWSLAKGHAYKEYEGITLDKPYRKVKSRIVVDFGSYYAMDDSEKPDFTSEYLSNVDGNEAANMASECTCAACASRPQQNKSNRASFADYDGVDPEGEPPNWDHFFFLCRPEVPAYILGERKWEWLDAEYVQDIGVQKDAFKSLVLDQEIKGVVEALSRTHIQHKLKDKINTDFIKGKGEGRIFLLHGPPGVGKTCTAESVAELLERPLLALTCGDIGTKAEAVERSLDKFLTWGELWGAVVLLDEADIYLEKRAYSDVERNSVVSVFLRALEYYRGLLFLTTNRVNSFDEAFKSRIHVSLHYRKLDDDDRDAIWNNFFRRSIKDGVEVTKKARKFIREDETLQRLEWNGREIRNAFQTAIALAQFGGEGNDEGNIQVTSKHMQRVVNMAKAFTDYCFTVNRGRNDSERMREGKVRNDFFGQTKKSKKAELAAKSKKKSRKQESESEGESTEDEDAEKAKRKNSTKSTKEERESDEDMSEDESDVPPKKRKSSKAKKSTPQDDSTEEDSAEEEKATRTKSKDKKRSKRKPVDDEDESDESEE